MARPAGLSLRDDFLTPLAEAIRDYLWQAMNYQNEDEKIIIWVIVVIFAVFVIVTFFLTKDSQRQHPKAPTPNNLREWSYVKHAHD